MDLFRAPSVSSGSGAPHHSDDELMFDMDRDGFAGSRAPKKPSSTGQCHSPLRVSSPHELQLHQGTSPQRDRDARSHSSFAIPPPLQLAAAQNRIHMVSAPVPLPSPPADGIASTADAVPIGGSLTNRPAPALEFALCAAGSFKDGRSLTGSAADHAAPSPATPIQHIVVRNEETQEMDLARSRRDKSKKKVCVADFELLSVIGKGAYGKVFLVRKNSTHKVYAMKVLRKDKMTKSKDIVHTKEERRVLEVIQHPFIVNLRFAFQTDLKLYLVLDYVPGGELFKRLDDAQDLSEEDARFYAAEVIVALEHLHSLDIIYRDLKPENILLQQDGHISLTDFGFAKKGMSDDAETKTFCGTAHYMSPEIVSKTGHGKPADWWALGVLIYEMLTGRTPFQASNRKVIHQNILNMKITFPNFISPDCKSLLKGLLSRHIPKRLGYNGSKEIKEHLFFRGINWSTVASKGLRPPFIPAIAHMEDVSNFDKEFTGEAVVDSPVHSAKDPVEQSGDQVLSRSFSGFSYVCSPLATPQPSPLTRGLSEGGALPLPLPAVYPHHLHPPHGLSAGAGRPSPVLTSRSNGSSGAVMGPPSPLVRAASQGLPAGSGQAAGTYGNMSLHAYTPMSPVFRAGSLPHVTPGLPPLPPGAFGHGPASLHAFPPPVLVSPPRGSSTSASHRLGPPGFGSNPTGSQNPGMGSPTRGSLVKLPPAQPSPRDDASFSFTQTSVGQERSLSSGPVVHGRATSGVFSFAQAGSSSSILNASTFVSSERASVLGGSGHPPLHPGTHPGTQANGLQLVHATNHPASGSGHPRTGLTAWTLLSGTDSAMGTNSSASNTGSLTLSHAPGVATTGVMSSASSLLMNDAHSKEDVLSMGSSTATGSSAPPGSAKKKKKRNRGKGKNGQLDLAVSSPANRSPPALKPSITSPASKPNGNTSAGVIGASWSGVLRKGSPTSPTSVVTVSTDCKQASTAVPERSQSKAAARPPPADDEWEVVGTRGRGKR